MDKSTPNYRHFLKTELSSRARINSSYSLRAFARDIGISPSSLSLVLDGSQGLSVERAKNIALRIGLDQNELQLFCDLVESEHGRSKVKRKLAQERLSKYQEKNQKPVSLELFSIISDWFHYAILELTYLSDFKGSITWIAKKLKISKVEAKEAVDRLYKVGMIEKRGNSFCATEDFSLSQNEVASASLKKFHKQILNKAIMAIDEQEIERRDFSSMTFAFNSKDMEKAKADLMEFRRDFMKKYEGSVKKDAVYNLSLQFFNLTDS